MFIPFVYLRIFSFINSFMGKEGLLWSATQPFLVSSHNAPPKQLCSSLGLLLLTVGEVFCIHGIISGKWYTNLLANALVLKERPHCIIL